MGMEFPVDPVTRLQIFPGEGESTAAQGGVRDEGDSTAALFANGSLGAGLAVAEPRLGASTASSLGKPDGRSNGADAASVGTGICGETACSESEADNGYVLDEEAGHDPEAGERFAVIREHAAVKMQHRHSRRGKLIHRHPGGQEKVRIKKHILLGANLY